MKLVWSAFALSDRDGIFTHIVAESPRAATALDERIAAAVHRLVDFPRVGALAAWPAHASSSLWARPMSLPTL
nr:hypothetical protein BDOA9_0143930 [Bradyrhizobium sp. DOA9]